MAKRLKGGDHRTRDLERLRYILHDNTMEAGHDILQILQEHGGIQNLVLDGDDITYDDIGHYAVRTADPELLMFLCNQLTVAEVLDIDPEILTMVPLKSLGPTYLDAVIKEYKFVDFRDCMYEDMLAIVRYVEKRITGPLLDSMPLRGGTYTCFATCVAWADTLFAKEMNMWEALKTFHRLDCTVFTSDIKSIIFSFMGIKASTKLSAFDPGELRKARAIRLNARESTLLALNRIDTDRSVGRRPSTNCCAVFLPTVKRTIFEFMGVRLFDLGDTSNLPIVFDPSYVMPFPKRSPFKVNFANDCAKFYKNKTWPRSDDVVKKNMRRAICCFVNAGFRHHLRSQTLNADYVHSIQDIKRTVINVSMDGCPQDDDFLLLWHVARFMAALSNGRVLHLPTIEMDPDYFPWAKWGCIDRFLELMFIQHGVGDMFGNDSKSHAAYVISIAIAEGAPEDLFNDLLALLNLVELALGGEVDGQMDTLIADLSKIV